MLRLLFKGKDERKLVKVQEGWLQPFETEGWLQLDPKGDWITESIYGITRTHDQRKEQPQKLAYLPLLDLCQPK